MSARYYRLPLVKGGRLCGVKIWRGFPHDPDTGEELTERPILWRAEIEGTEEPIEGVAPWIVDGTGDAPKGTEISEEDYRLMTAKAQWAAKYAPHEPEAKPRAKIDHLQGDLIF